MKICRVCSGPIEPPTRQKRYCAACKREVHRRRQAEYRDRAKNLLLTVSEDDEEGGNYVLAGTGINLPKPKAAKKQEFKFLPEPCPGKTATQVIRMQRSAGYTSYGQYMVAMREKMKREETANAER